MLVAGRLIRPHLETLRLRGQHGHRTASANEPIKASAVSADAGYLLLNKNNVMMFRRADNQLNLRSSTGTEPKKTLIETELNYCREVLSTTKAL